MSRHESQARVKVLPNHWRDCDLCWHGEPSDDAQDTAIGQHLYTLSLCGRHRGALIDAISPGFRQQNAELLTALKEMLVWIDDPEAWRAVKAAIAKAEEEP